MHVRSSIIYCIFLYLVALLYKNYSTDSDVWSYGMVLFEIWSVGKKPLSKLANNQAMKLLQTGHCQSPLPGCPRAIYKLMVDCWYSNIILYTHAANAKLVATIVYDA